MGHPFKLAAGGNYGGNMAEFPQSQLQSRSVSVNTRKGQRHESLFYLHFVSVIDIHNGGGRARHCGSQARAGRPHDDLYQIIWSGRGDVATDDRDSLAKPDGLDPQPFNFFQSVRLGEGKKEKKRHK